MTSGWIHVITGCMFSGKTDELLRHLRRAEIAGRRIVLIRPAVDDRTPSGTVASRSGVNFSARSVSDSSGIPAGEMPFHRSSQIHSAQTMCRAVSRSDG